jgi:hypothetical protein
MHVRIVQNPDAVVELEVLVPIDLRTDGCAPPDVKGAGIIDPTALQGCHVIGGPKTDEPR